MQSVTYCIFFVTSYSSFCMSFTFCLNYSVLLHYFCTLSGVKKKQNVDLWGKGEYYGQH